MESHDTDGDSATLLDAVILQEAAAEGAESDILPVPRFANAAGEQAARPCQAHVCRFSAIA